MDVATSANRTTEAGRDFVIAEIDVRAATGAIGRRRLIADFVFALTFETSDDAIALPAPNRFELAMERQFLRRRGFVFEFQAWLGR
jgi:hypothetical protein